MSLSQNLKLKTLWLQSTIDIFSIEAIVTRFFNKKDLQEVVAFPDIAQDVTKNKSTIDFFTEESIKLKELSKKLALSSKRRKKAEKSSICKSSLLSAVAHDIRAPMSGVGTMVDMLLNKQEYNISKEEEIEFLEVIKESAAEMLEFANDLLDVGQAENGNFRLKEVKENNIEELINRSVTIVRSKALRVSIQIQIDVKGDIPKLKCDARRMKQILVNLLINSIKYSKKDTLITITVRKINQDNKIIEIIVKDQGIGISKQDIKKVLQKYHIINNANYKKVDSLGLGLALVKHLVEQHRGVLEIKSQVNKGSEFIMRY